MLAKALKSFKGRYGLIQTGMKFECEPGYFDSLKRNGLAEEATAGDKPTPGAPGPSANRAVPTAPVKAATVGKESTGAATAQSSAPPPAGGKVTTSRSLRAALASAAKTSTPSDAGETPKT